MTEAWIVGGALRDDLLGREVRDVDVAVAGDPARAARALAAEVRGPVFQLSEAFGAWRVIDRGGERIYDFAPLQGDSIEADLRRRDFTVNAMARPVAPEQLGGAVAPHGDLIDPLGGRADLEARTLRVLGPEAYESDPLRALRLTRFVAELGFAPDPETERLTREHAARVAEAAGERVFAELRRLVLAGGALEGLALADRLGVMRAACSRVSRSVSGSGVKPSSATKRVRRRARSGSLSYAPGPSTRRVRASRSARPPSGSIRSPCGVTAPPSSSGATGRAIALIVKSRRRRSASIESPWSGAKS